MTTKNLVPALFVLVACGSSGGGDTISKIEGTATVAGKPAKITGCSIEKLTSPSRPGLVVTLEGGYKFRSDGYDGPRVAKGSGAWEKTECERNSSQEEGSSDWAKGTLGITCTHADGPIVIDATFDCGATSRPSNRKN